MNVVACLLKFSSVRKHVQKSRFQRTADHLYRWLWGFIKYAAADRIERTPERIRTSEIRIIKANSLHCPPFPRNVRSGIVVVGSTSVAVLMTVALKWILSEWMAPWDSVWQGNGGDAFRGTFWPRMESDYDVIITDRASKRWCPFRDKCQGMKFYNWIFDHYWRCRFATSSWRCRPSFWLGYSGCQIRANNEIGWRTVSRAMG